MGIPSFRTGMEFDNFMSCFIGICHQTHPLL
jgi:hypothetical protein